MGKIKIGYMGGNLFATLDGKDIAFIYYTREIEYLGHSKKTYPEIEEFAKSGNYIFSNGGKLLSDVTEIMLCPLNEPSLMYHNPYMGETYLFSVETINGVEYVCGNHYIQTKKENPKDDMWSANYIPCTKDDYTPISQEMLDQYRKDGYRLIKDK